MSQGIGDGLGAAAGPDRGRRRWTLPLAAIAAAGGLAALLLARRRRAEPLWALLNSARGAGEAGWATAAAVQAGVAATGVLPASLTGLAAGAVYGIGLGFALAAIGTMAGALLAFGLSRSLARGLVLRWLGRSAGGRRRWLARLDDAIVRDGWRTVCLLRLSPVMPFAATSYALGLTGVRLRDYLLGTLASLPALLGYVVMGHLAGSGLQAATHGAGMTRWVMLGIGLVATLALTLRIGRLAGGVSLGQAEPDRSN